MEPRFPHTVGCLCVAGRITHVLRRDRRCHAVAILVVPVLFKDQPASTVDDEPTTFYFNGKSYEPADDDSEYSGAVTLRFALAHSLNVPAVRVAEITGYDKVARVARAAGLGTNIKATPSIALGSYEVTPLELASAYSIFVNSGRLVKTSFISSIRWCKPEHLR